MNFRESAKEIAVARITPYLASTIAAALIVFAFSSAPHAAGTFEQRQACMQDAFKFCSHEIPNIERITACMIRNLKDLSPRCRAQFEEAAQR